MTTTNAELIAEARAIVRAVGDGSSFDGRPAWLVIQDLADALESATTVSKEMVERAAESMWELRTRPSDPAWDLLDYGVKVEYRKDALHALTAALTEGERR